MSTVWGFASLWTHAVHTFKPVQFCQLQFSSLYVDGVLLRLCTIVALHKVPYIHHIFLFNHQRSTILQRIKWKDSTPDCPYPRWYLWAIDHTVALLYLVKISLRINKPSAFPISWLADTNTWSFCQLQWQVTKAIWNRDRSRVSSDPSLELVAAQSQINQYSVYNTCNYMLHPVQWVWGRRG